MLSGAPNYPTKCLPLSTQWVDSPLGRSKWAHRVLLRIQHRNSVFYQRSSTRKSLARKFHLTWRAAQTPAVLSNEPASATRWTLQRTIAFIFKVCSRVMRSQALLSARFPLHPVIFLKESLFEPLAKKAERSGVSVWRVCVLYDFVELFWCSVLFILIISWLLARGLARRKFREKS